jgi:rare lipoprotein A
MQSQFKTWATIVAILAVSAFFLSCTPENANLKKSDHKVAKSGQTSDDSGYDEESNDFEEDAGDEAVSVKKSKSDDKEESDDDSSYTKDTYYQTGMASWYGREFDGKKTASGERFDMNELTAAHKTLPFGTIVSVKDFETGKTVKVRINDRGPYRGKRILDVSYGAAKKLGIIKKGETKVGIKIVKKGSGSADDEGENGNNLEAVSGDTARDDSGSGNFAVQAGAFYSKRNADNLKTRIEQLTGNDVVVVHDGDMYKVRIEGLNTKKEVSRIKKALSDEEIPSYLVK